MNIVLRSAFSILVILFIFTEELQAFQDHSHESSSTKADTAQHQDHVDRHQQQTDETTKGWDHPEKVTADFEDFPNLHPLFVHFPVALIPFAAFFQLLGLFIYRRELSWVVLILIVVGFIGGYIAANFVHPHVGDLPQHAKEVYDMHDTYASWTLWLSGMGALLKGISHFLLHRTKWAEIVVLIVITGSAFTVSMAGHYGSQLVFIENVGPQGNYLNEGKHSH